MKKLAGIVTICLLLAASPAGATSKADDKRIAKEGDFHADDFPAGWKESKPDESSTSTEDECPSIDKKAKALRKGSPRVNSKKFEQSDESYESSVQVLPTEAKAQRLYETVSSPKALECLRTATKKSVEEAVADSPGGGSVDKAEASTVTGSNYGSESTHFQFTFTLSYENLGLEPKAYLNLVAVRVGRAVAFYTRAAETELSPPSEYDTDEVTLDGLVAKAVDRLAVALGGQPQPAQAGDGSTPQNLNVGQSGTSGNSRVTVYAWEQPAAVPSNRAIAPDPGNEYGAADVEVCATETAVEPVQASTFNFAVVGPDNVRHTAEPSWREPALASTALYAGDCVRGWNTFEVTAGQRPAFVEWGNTFGGTGNVPLRWHL